MADKKVDQRTLEYLGIDYEYKLIKILIEDSKFFNCLEPILDQNAFTTPEFRDIVRIMKDLSKETAGAPLTYDIIDVTVRSTISERQRLTKTLDVLKRVRDVIDNTFFDQHKDIAEKFFKQQGLVKAINEARKIIEKGDYYNYDRIPEMIAKPLDISYRNNCEFHIFDDDWEQAMDEKARDVIPTGCPDIDDLLMGGIGKGELGVIIAPSGVGKTSTTCGFAANAALNGKKVLHIFFEGTDNEIKRKYYGYVLQDIEAGELLNPQFAELARHRLKTDQYCKDARKLLRENIVCHHGSSGEMSAADIATLVKHHISRGFYPDMVIVDYFECIKLEALSSNENEYTREGYTMRKLENICKEFNIAGWVPVQGTKDSFNAEIIGMAQSGGSIKKVQIGHIVISLAKTALRGTKDGVSVLNFALLKFRPGAIKSGGIVSNIEFNNGTCRFGNLVNNDGGGGGYSDERVRVANETKKQIA